MPSQTLATPNSKPIRWLLRLGILTVLSVAIGISLRTRFSQSASDLSRLNTSLTHKVGRGDLLVSVTADGTVESSVNKEIKSKVKGGSIVLWVIEPGTSVQPGDELIKLDTSTIEDEITQQQIAYENALANKITSESTVAVAETSITEYVNGIFLAERSTIQKEIFDAQQAVKKAQLALESADRLAAKGMIRSLQLDSAAFAVESAQKDLELKQTRLEALEKYTKEKTLQELHSALQAAEARLASDKAALKLESDRLERAQQQLENCIIRAEASGMVILPSAAAWKDEPDIEEGAIVREQQTLLIIPDLNQMQVKVGIHEAKVDRLRVGQPAKVRMQDLTIDGVVDSVATVTRPAGWWSGNMVKYDTIVKLEGHSALKPGMSAIAEIYLADYADVLLIPVAAVMEDALGFHCYVKTETQAQRRALELGDNNEEFLIVESGLTEGEEVILNPQAFLADDNLEAIPKKSAEDPAVSKTSSELPLAGDSSTNSQSSDS